MFSVLKLSLIKSDVRPAKIIRGNDHDSFGIDYWSLSAFAINGRRRYEGAPGDEFFFPDLLSGFVAPLLAMRQFPYFICNASQTFIPSQIGPQEVQTTC
jgi:hypothetical protein